MVRDAAAHAAEDRAGRELIDARNAADALVYSVEKTVTDQRDQLPADEVSRIEAALAAARDAVGSEDVSRIREATVALQTASHWVAETLYTNAASAGSASGETEEDAGDVVDAEFAETTD